MPDPVSSLPGADDITEVTLPNGITILTRPNFNSPSVVINAYLHAGSIFDPDDKLGLANFTVAALMHGTRQRSHLEIYEALEAVGASLGFDAAIHIVGFNGKALAEDLDLLLELASECLREPDFPEDEIERIRARILTGLALRAQNPESMASLTFDQIVYRGHPYSRPEDGHPDTVRNISREDMRAFHRRFFGPRGMVVVVVGGVEPAQAIEKVSRVFGDWQNSGQPEMATLPPLRPLDGNLHRQAFIPGTSQSSIVMGVAGPPRNAPGFLAASLGNNVLGQFGMYGRIGEAVREKSGLAYYAYSSLSGGVGPGPWYFVAGVAPDNVERTIDLIRGEIERFIRQGISEEELADSKANYIGRLPLSLESNAGVSAALISLKRYGLGLDYYRTYADRVNAVTREEILEVARQYLDPEKLAIAVAGPK